MNSNKVEIKPRKLKRKTTHFDMLEIDIVSESVRPELKLANSESRRETGL